MNARQARVHSRLKLGKFLQYQKKKFLNILLFLSFFGVIVANMLGFWIEFSEKYCQRLTNCQMGFIDTQRETVC